MPNVFASENLFHGMSSFEQFPSAIVPDNSQIIEIKLQYQNGPYSLSDFKPIVDVNPKEAAPYVHIEFEPLGDVFLHSVNRIFGTITVDKEIPNKMIFLNISYVGTNSNGISLRSGWNDSAIIEIRENMVGGTLDRTVYPISSPLKQFKSGIPNYKITCKEGLKLLIRTNAGPAACVKPDTATELQTRWHKMDSKSNNSEINTMCMTLEKSKDTATFFKVPSYLPDGYSFECSFLGTPYESYMIFHNKKIPDELDLRIEQLILDGAIFIHQTDERNFVGAEKFETIGTPEQRIQETYDSVMDGNPSLNPQLIRINGMLAYAVDSCSDCGMQTANFTDGVIIQKTATEAKIKFIDKNGVNYFINAGIPLNELIKVAESLQ